MMSKHTTQVPAVSWTFDEGRYWDLWMFVHLGVGVLIAVANSFVHIIDPVLYSGTLIGLTLYEVWEMVEGIEEALENWIMDIVVGMAGLTVAHEFIVPHLTSVTAGMLLGVVVLWVAGGTVMGWRAYRRRSL